MTRSVPYQWAMRAWEKVPATGECSAFGLAGLQSGAFRGVPQPPEALRRQDSRQKRLILGRLCRCWGGLEGQWADETQEAAAVMPC